MRADLQRSSPVVDEQVVSHPLDPPDPSGELAAPARASARPRGPFDPRSLDAPTSESAPLVQRLRSAIPGLAVALAALVLVGPSPDPSPLQRIACARAGLVDGRLHCDAELPAEPAALCPPGRGPASYELVAAGDAFDTAQLCARSFASPQEPSSGWARMEPEELAALGQPVDVNEASLAELESLPRVGPKLARRIAEGRPYADVDALERVRGIGPSTLLRLRDRAVVNLRASR
jgi:competence protein ComEA